MNGVNCLRMKT